MPYLRPLRHGSSVTEYFLGCDPGLGHITGNCCNEPGKPCYEGEGDCDRDSHCAGDLVCGKDNCRRFNPASPATHDCCEKSRCTITAGCGTPYHDDVILDVWIKR